MIEGLNVVCFNHYMSDPSTQEKRWRELMLKSLHHDTESYQTLLIEIGHYIERILRKKIYNENNIHDCLQDILLAVHKARLSFQKNRQFLPWLNAIINYKTIDLIRKTSRISNNELYTQEISQKEISKNFDFHDDYRDLISTVETLPKKLKEAFIKVKIEQLSTKEAAKELNISEDNLRARVSRAMKFIKEKLETL